MNPVVLKALIISGGTIGLGVPSIYYGYPHISKLINPSTEEDKKPAGESASIGTITSPENTPEDGKETREDSQRTENLASNVSGNGDSTDTQNSDQRVHGTSSPNNKESNSGKEGVNQNSEERGESASSSDTPTQSGSEKGNDSKAKQQ